MDKWFVLLIVVMVIGIVAWIVEWLRMRKKYISFTEAVCGAVDTILKGESTEDFELAQDTLFSKVQMRLKRLSDITEASVLENDRQKRAVQSVVSDISHQLKTPIANITMYCDTIMRQELTEEVQSQCMDILNSQVKKLEFLTQSLLKMSRLENNIITLHPEWNSLYETIYEVADSIQGKAARKNLDIQIDCPKELQLNYDAKWTAEAIFNVVDNSVKYTEECGKIMISVEPLEMFTRIQIKDTGVGITPENVNNVWKRFFREEKVAHAEGVGLGLFLTREIIMKQDGYVKIQSEEGNGTAVSLYLLNHKNGFLL